MQEKNKKHFLYGIGILAGAFLLIIGVLVYKNQHQSEKINILCLGIDKMVPLEERDPVTNSIGQADAVFLVSIDTKSGEINVIGIPRDTMVYVEKYNSDLNYMGTEALQICTQYAYADGTIKSCELTKDRVEELFPNITIDAYVAININAIMEINDVIGGVEVVIEDDYTAFQMSKWKGSTVNLMGIDTMNYLRVRDCTVGESAYGRIERIKQYIQGFIPKVKEAIKKDPKIIADIYNSMEENMVTNLELSEIIDIAKIVTMLYSIEDIHMYTLEGQIYVNEDGFEEFYPDTVALEKIQDLLE